MATDFSKKNKPIGSIFPIECSACHKVYWYVDDLYVELEERPKVYGDPILDHIKYVYNCV